MDILNKKDYDRCERNGFKLNQKVLFTNDKKETVKSRILAIDTTYSDGFGFFVKDKNGNYCKDITGCGVKEVFDKNGTWCRKENIAPITDDKSVPFNIEDHINKSLSLCAETNDEKLKYSKYKNRVFFVKAVDGTELGLSNVNKLEEVNKEKDAEAVVIMFQNSSYDIENLLRTIMFLNPENHSTILECVISNKDNEDLLCALVNYELIISFSYDVVNTSRAVLIKI